MADADSLAAALEEIRMRDDRARHPEDDGNLYIAAAAVAVALGEAPGWTVRRSGVSAEVYEDGRGVPAWRVWVERGKDGHLIAGGEFGRSARDVPRLLAAVEAVLKLAAAAKPVTWWNGTRSAAAWTLDPEEVGAAITRALLGEEKEDGG